MQSPPGRIALDGSDVGVEGECQVVEGSLLGGVRGGETVYVGLDEQGARVRGLQAGGEARAAQSRVIVGAGHAEGGLLESQAHVGEQECDEGDRRRRDERPSEPEADVAGRRHGEIASFPAGLATLSALALRGGFGRGFREVDGLGSAWSGSPCVAAIHACTRGQSTPARASTDATPRASINTAGRLTPGMFHSHSTLPWINQYSTPMASMVSHA